MEDAEIDKVRTKTLPYPTLPTMRRVALFPCRHRGHLGTELQLVPWRRYLRVENRVLIAMGVIL